MAPPEEHFEDHTFGQGGGVARGAPGGLRVETVMGNISRTTPMGGGNAARGAPVESRVDGPFTDQFEDELADRRRGQDLAEKNDACG